MTIKRVGEHKRGAHPFPFQIVKFTFFCFQSTQNAKIWTKTTKQIKSSKIKRKTWIQEVRAKGKLQGLLTHKPFSPKNGKSPKRLNFFLLKKTTYLISFRNWSIWVKNLFKPLYFYESKCCESKIDFQISKKNNIYDKSFHLKHVLRNDPNE